MLHIGSELVRIILTNFFFTETNRKRIYSILWKRLTKYSKSINVTKEKYLVLMKKIYLTGFILLALIILSFLVICSLDEDKAFKLSVEDGIIEYLSGLFFFMAALVSFYHFYYVKSGGDNYLFRTGRNYLILLLGLFFLFCAGEEISWGQRVFGIATPEFMEKENAQKEFNFHNLYMFQGIDRDQNLKSGLKYWFTGHKLFAYFWITFCLLIPLASALYSKSNDFLKRISFPVMPVWLGGVFLVNHVVSKVCEGMNLFSWPTPIVETKETIFAFLFLVSTIYIYSDHKKLGAKTSQI